MLSFRWRRVHYYKVVTSMRIARLTASFAAAMFAMCVTANTRHAQMKEINTYPLFATPERAAKIREGFPQIRVGMSPAEVMALLGEPDEVHPLYEPRVKNAEVIGFTHWYLIRRLAKYGSVNEKQESLVRVSFSLNDRVSKIDAWGL